MDPLLTNGIDASLLRVIEKRSNDRDATPRRRRTATLEKAKKNEQKDEADENPQTPKHAFDDLA